MRKKERHRLITRLLSEQDIQKQEEFVELLQEKGVATATAFLKKRQKMSLPN